MGPDPKKVTTPAPASRSPRSEAVAPSRRGRSAHPHFHGEIRYTAYARPADDEHATAGTIALMQRFSTEDAHSPFVRAAAQEAVRELPAHDQRQQAAAVWQWIRSRVRLVSDAELARPLAGVDADDAEVLIRPVDLLRMRDRAGDCDDQAMLAAAMLRALGIPSAFRTIAADSSAPHQYSHVYLVAYPARGAPLALDVSHGPYAGWSAPAIGKSRLWSQPMKPLGAIDWGGLLQTGVQTTANILTARLGQPPAGTYIQRNGSVTYRQLPGTQLQFPTTQLTGGWSGIILLAVVALVLILALRGRS